MATILLDFPARRYHATPWGHHVNEGLVEWPPSPWRLLRALLATGYTTLHWNDDGPPAVARALIEKLSSVLPRYQLPKATGAHSRHYMPLATFKGGREDTTLVFDTWLQIHRGTLSVTWDVALAAEERQMLSELVERLGYLGRSESWVLGRLASSDDISTRGDECVPCSEAETPGRGWEQIPMIVPLSATRYEQWRRAAIESEMEVTDPADGNQTAKGEKKLLGKRQKLEELYPSDLCRCLQTTTHWLRNGGWSRPPGSERVFYRRRIGSLQDGARVVTQRGVSVPPVEAMLLSIATASRNDHALPSLTRALPQAELLHLAFASVAGKRGQHSRTLTGCDEEGKPLRGPHDHAHILPLDLDCDGHLDHFVIWAARGLDANDQAIVRTVRKTFSKGSEVPLGISVVGAGRLHDLVCLPGACGQALRKLFGTRSLTWRSVTPFIPPRHLKKRGRNTLAGQVAAELASRHLPQDVEVRVIDPHENEDARRHRHFARRRRHGPAAPVDQGFTLELQFPVAIRGPLSLGYGSHFGLGLFTAVELTS